MCHGDGACNVKLAFAAEIEPAERTFTALRDLRCPVPGRQTGDAARLREGLHARKVDRHGVSPEVRGSKVTPATRPIGDDENVTGHHASLCSQIDS
jgi:hypothetical protein